MEVSTKNGTNIQWTEEARLGIRKLVRLNGFQKSEKNSIV